jgi:hypothetical protein
MRSSLLPKSFACGIIARELESWSTESGSAQWRAIVRQRDRSIRTTTFTGGRVMPTEDVLLIDTRASAWRDSR